MAQRVKKSRASSSSSSSSRPAKSPSLPDRLSKLPSEIQDWIFALIPDIEAPRLPICKALLRSQRRRIKSVRIPAKANPKRATAFLSRVENLKELFFRAPADVTTLLAALPEPERLEELTVLSGCDFDYIEPLPKVRRSVHYSKLPVLGAEFAAPLARLSGLKTLYLDTSVNLSDPALVSALHRTRLETLELGDATSDVLSAAQLTPLVSGLTKLPHLKNLKLHFVSGETGTPASECTKDWHFDDWKMPDWPKQFPRADLEKLVKGAEVEVDGSAVEAMQIEDTYEEEKKEYNKEKVMCGRPRFRR